MLFYRSILNVSLTPSHNPEHRTCHFQGTMAKNQALTSKVVIFIKSKSYQDRIWPARTSVCGNTHTPVLTAVVNFSVNIPSFKLY